ncbi:hypothetical protein [Paragemmobacter aquarius]|nr:hypothetical protein [Gemmobacter aquarius]
MARAAGLLDLKVKEGGLKRRFVARLVDAEVLRKMGAERMGGDG